MVVIVIGLGNIGSFLAPHLARTPEIDWLTLIDRDGYEDSNVRSQNIQQRDVGRRKAYAQARRLRGIRPTLRLHPVVAPVESLPLGVLRADLILTCLDSRRSRQYVNQAVRRLGVPWIDAGVEPTTPLVRVSAFLPVGAQSCMECSWDDRDYGLLAHEFSCGKGSASVPRPTGAMSSLGALAASLQALEAWEFLRGRKSAEKFGRQVVLDPAHHKCQVSSIGRNPACRLSCHVPWEIERLGGDAAEMTLGQALELGPGETARSSLLSIAGSDFVARLRCRECPGQEKRLLYLRASISPRRARCMRCGSGMIATAADAMEELDGSRLSDRDLRRTLRKLGLRPGEVLRIAGRGEERYFEIPPADPAQEAACATRS